MKIKLKKTKTAATPIEVEIAGVKVTVRSDAELIQAMKTHGTHVVMEPFSPEDDAEYKKRLAARMKAKA